MKYEGPPLEELTHRLADCPNDFLSEPRVGRKEGVHTDAVVSDLLCDLGQPPLNQSPARAFATEPTRFGVNRSRLIAICCWLLHHPWFRSRTEHNVHVPAFLAKGLDELARAVSASKFHQEPERREELARLVLRGLDLRPAGESIEMAIDRLSTVDSVERQKLIRASKRNRERLLEIMKKKAEEQAAAKVTRE